MTTERPILFSTEMVRALLEGRKTQTRRAIRPQPDEEFRVLGVEWYEPTRIGRNGEEEPGPEIFGVYGDEEGYRCPYGGPGDRLWVRETWQDYCPMWQGSWCGHGTKEGMANDHQPVYRADDPALWLRGPKDKQAPPAKWRPSIFMPRWASRLTLEVAGVRVERLHDISQEDARAEGMPADVANSPRVWYMTLWDSINGAGSWDANPWVWVIEFRPVAE